MRSLVIVCLLYVYLFSAPAFNKVREFHQADGTVFVARAKGDSYLNWIETLDGEVLKYNQKTKNFEYVIIKNDKLQVTGIKYQQNNTKKAKSLKLKDSVKMGELYKLWSKRRKAYH